MRLLKMVLFVCALALVVGTATPVEAQDSSCTREVSNVQICWDDVDAETCAEALSGTYREGTVCFELGPFDGVCVDERRAEGGTPECCEIRSNVDSTDPAREACEGPLQGRWVEDETCESVPVELQLFDVEKK